MTRARRKQSRLAVDAWWLFDVERCTGLLLALTFGCQPPAAPPPQVHAMAPLAVRALPCSCADARLTRARELVAEGRLDRAWRWLHHNESECKCLSEDAKQFSNALYRELSQGLSPVETTDVSSNCSLQPQSSEPPAAVTENLALGMGELNQKNQSAAQRLFDKALWQLEQWGRCAKRIAGVVLDAPVGFGIASTALSGSPDGQQVATDVADRVAIYSLPQRPMQDGSPGKALYRLSLPIGDKAAAICWPRRDRIVIGTSTGRLLLYDPERAQLLAEQSIAPVTSQAVQFMPGLGLVASAHTDAFVRFWEPDTLALVGSVHLSATPHAFAAGDRDFVVGLAPRGIVLYQHKASQTRLGDFTLRQWVGDGSSVAITAQGDRVAWSDTELDLKGGNSRSFSTPLNHLSYWNDRLLGAAGGDVLLAGDSERGNPWLMGHAWMSAMVVIARSNQLATRLGGNLNIWDLPTRTLKIENVNEGSIPSAIDVCSSTRAILLGDNAWWPEQGRLELLTHNSRGQACVGANWALVATPGQLVAFDLTQTGNVPVATYSTDGGFASLSGSSNGAFALSVNGSKQVLAGNVTKPGLKQIRLPVGAGTLAQGDGWVAVADRSLYWLTDGARARKVADGTGNILATNPAGDRLVIGGNQGILEVRDGSGQVLNRFDTLAGKITAVTLHPNRPWIAWGTKTGDIGLSDLHGVRVSVQIKTIPNPIKALRFWDDEWLISSSDSDWRLRFWSVRTHEQGPTVLKLTNAGHVAISNDLTPFVQVLEPRAREALKCNLGSYSFPFELCAERFEVPDLTRRLLAHDRSYRDP